MLGNSSVCIFWVFVCTMGKFLFTSSFTFTIYLREAVLIGGEDWTKVRPRTFEKIVYCKTDPPHSPTVMIFLSKFL